MSWYKINQTVRFDFEEEPEKYKSSMIGTDTVMAFLSSFFLTLTAIGMISGLLYIHSRAMQAMGAYDEATAQAELINAVDSLSAFRWTVRGIFPYFILLLELLLLITRFVAFVTQSA